MAEVARARSPAPHPSLASRMNVFLAGSSRDGAPQPTGASDRQSPRPRRRLKVSQGLAAQLQKFEQSTSGFTKPQPAGISSSPGALNKPIRFLEPVGVRDEVRRMATEVTATGSQPARE